MKVMDKINLIPNEELVESQTKAVKKRNFDVTQDFSFLERRYNSYLMM
jgi:hypothetical protein